MGYLSFKDVRNRLDRISLDIEKSTERSLLAASRDLVQLDKQLLGMDPEPKQLQDCVSRAREALGVAKLGEAQEWISRAREKGFGSHGKSK